MKKTDLYKNEGLKINSRLKQAGVPGRFGAESNSVPDRRQQRQADRAAGLVPFAVKLDKELVDQLQSLARSRNVPLNDVAGEVIAAGLKAITA